MQPKNTTTKPAHSNEQLLVKDAGKIGATMMQLSFSALKLFGGMIKFAFRASKLIIDTSLKIARHKPDARSKETAAKV